MAMSGHAALVLGAGFSKPLGGPLLSELLDPRLAKTSSADPEVLNTLRAMADENIDGFGRYDLEALFSRIYTERWTGGAIRIEGKEWDPENLLKSIYLHLSSVCGSLRFDKRKSISRSYTEFLASLFRNHSSLTIVTFNYDVIAEQALAAGGISYGYGNLRGFNFESFDPGSRMTNADHRVDILKLHGSANWGVCRSCRAATTTVDSVTIFDKPYIPIRRKRCPRCGGQMLEAGIVPPILNKVGEFSFLADVWKKARLRLRRARHITVVGYSLPKGDTEARGILREIPGPPKRSRVTLICGPNGAPQTYEGFPWNFDDSGMYFENYLESIL